MSYRQNPAPWMRSSAEHHESRPFPWHVWRLLVLKPFSLFFGPGRVYVESDDAVVGNKTLIRARRGQVGWGQKSRPVAAFLRVVARHGRHGAPRAAVRAPSAPATGPFGFSRITAFILPYPRFPGISRPPPPQSNARAPSIVLARPHEERLSLEIPQKCTESRFPQENARSTAFAADPVALRACPAAANATSTHAEKQHQPMLRKGNVLSCVIRQTFSISLTRREGPLRLRAGSAMLRLPQGTQWKP